MPLAFRPYLHQEQAFQRLGGPRPRSTLVATGTGSGKTESFLYPILDHCYRHRGEPGIKAILLYPMNALAMDQAGRLARAIWNNPRIKGHVTAGLLVGQSEKEPRRVMGPDGILTDRETQRLSPSDILLTNYKMLDYLLIRPRDFPLWRHNGAETLRFLVVDELHTFDGAQGTDLACLIRRLKARLGTPREFLCCVGTSATLGDGEGAGRLREYAEAVFGEPFDPDAPRPGSGQAPESSSGQALITESRVGVGEFLERCLIDRVEIVPRERAGLLEPDVYESYADYIRAQHELWFGEAVPAGAFNGPSGDSPCPSASSVQGGPSGGSRPGSEKDAWQVALGERLKGHLFFQNLLKVLNGRIRSYPEILGELERVTPDLRGADPAYRVNLLNSLLALVSEARVWAPKGTEPPTAPFLHVRVQTWLRELRRMVGEVRRQPRLRFADELNEEQRKVHLPVVHCRECGSMGWAGLKRQNELRVNPDLQAFYLGFFSHDPKVTFLFPEEGEVRAQGLDGELYHLCGACLHLTPRQDPEGCPSCGQGEPVRVFVPNSRVRRNDRVVSVHHCPYCGAREGLSLVGSQAASLTSVIIAQLYASGFNDDKKLLAFSDSVQDAAHRAGFFNARTYRFTLRGALQKFVLAEGEGITLAALPESFVRFWSERMDEQAYPATFLAPNMAWLRDYEHLKEHGRLPAGSKLRELVNRRLGWEIFSEYGFTARIGRTLEKSGASVAHLDPERLEGVISRLFERLRNEIGEMRGLDEPTLRRFLVGLVVHLKDRGAVFHPVLGPYIEDWGNTFRITQRHLPWMPGFGPHTRAPAFLTTCSGTRFDSLLGPSPRHRTWYQAWAEKCFTPINPLVGAVSDRLYELVLQALVEEGVIEELCNGHDRVWGLQPEALRISRHVLQFRCRRCGHNASVAAPQRVCWEGAPCLRFHCPGRYQEQEAGADYYGRLYATGDVERLFAAEHTGLLTREEREALEQKFKAADRRPWDPNLLSCTPTLEMGIDIGDLSSLILCSVPPCPASSGRC